MVEGAVRGEVERLCLCVVVVAHILLKLFFQRIPLVDKDGIGYIKVYISIYFWKLGYQLFTVFINSLDPSLMEAQGLFYFLFCSSGSSIVDHAQQIDDA